MKHRAAAILAAFAVVAAGALASPADATAPASALAAAPGVPGAAVQSLADLPGGDDPATPPDGPSTADLDGVAPAGKQPQTGEGALAAVLEAISRGDDIPDELSEQVRIDGDRIRVEVTHTDTSAARSAVVAAGGRDIVVVTDALLAADVPADAVATLEAAPAITAVTLPTLAVAPPEGLQVPSTIGAMGDDVYTKTQMARWHKLGLKGAGVSVGIVDYFNGDAWDDARAKGEVPQASGTFCRSNGQSCNIYGMPKPTGLHGVAVAETIHDMAPKAKLYLATVSTNEDLKKAIDYFASQGVKILSRSLGGFYDGPGDGTGPSGALVDYAVKKGIAWFNSAGNSGAYTQTFTDGEKAWVGGYWRDTWRDTDNDGWHEFKLYDIDPVSGQPTGTFTYSETMYVYCTPYFRLRWSDWGADQPSDYDIYRIVDGSAVAPGYPANYQTKKGDAPLELQDGSDSYFRCTSGWIQVGIYLDSAPSGAVGDILELQGNSGDVYEAASSPSSAGQAFADSKNPGMAAVGAVDPVDGQLIAGYSSQGPTNDGRIKPELSAGSNFTSRAYEASGQGGRFNGTSAATPVVAGAAAVVLERYASKTPAQLIDYLRKSQTTDRGAAGADNVYGTGELVMKPLAVAKFTSTPAPKITGTRAVGSTLKVTTGWKPAVKSAKYQWYRSGKAIPKATKATYKLTKSDAGKKIRVKVTGARPGYTSVAKYSAYTGAIAKTFTKSPAPKITGTVKVGRTLTASAGTWSPKYSKITYQWKADGKAIKGATKKTYKLTSSSAGKRITVTVKASKKGYLTKTKTSAKSAKVAR